MRGSPWSAFLILAAGALASACGAAFDGATYSAGGVTFHVPPPPESWQRIEAEGASLAFRDAGADATVMLSGRCGKGEDDVPLASLTQHLFLQFTDREQASQDVVPFDGREAMHTVLSAKLDGVAKKFDVWVMKKDGCVYDMIFLAAPARFDAGVGPFRAFVGGFSTVRGGG
jgi:hypothetical protein